MCSPYSRLFAGISLTKAIVSSESLGFLECGLDLCFGEHLEEFTRPSNVKRDALEDEYEQNTHC
jgi:hypothetical protein